MLSKDCIQCGISFPKPYFESLKDWIGRHKFCSVPCLNKWKIGKRTSTKTEFRKGNPAPKTAFKKGIRYSQSTEFGNKPPWNKGIPYLRISGERNNHWCGGITPLHEKIRKSLEYKDWRTAVFKRDKYTCQHCNQRQGDIEADHIKPFAFFPELRFEISNGRTLCNSCHRKTDTYGKGAYKYRIENKHQK